MFPLLLFLLFFVQVVTEKPEKTEFKLPENEAEAFLMSKTMGPQLQLMEYRAFQSKLSKTNPGESSQEISMYDIIVSVMFGQTPKDLMILMAAKVRLYASRIAAETPYGKYYDRLTMESVIGRSVDWKKYETAVVTEEFISLVKEYAAKFGSDLVFPWELYRKGLAENQNATNYQ